jgi:hypothetical protein
MEAYKENHGHFLHKETNLCCWINMQGVSGFHCQYLRLSKMCYSLISAIWSESVQLTKPFESALLRTEQAPRGLQLAGETMNEVRMLFVVVGLSVLIFVFFNLVLGACDHHEHAATTKDYVTSNKGTNHLGNHSDMLGAFAKLRTVNIRLVIPVYISLSVCPSVRMKQLLSHWTDFHEIQYLSIFRKKMSRQLTSQ